MDRWGEIIERRESGDGILHVPGGCFAAVLDRQIGNWRSANPKIPVVACGMIGSRNGWCEVPYVSCPGTLEHLARGLHRIAEDMIYVVPGMSCRGVNGPDVMRGEETQLIGALFARPIEPSPVAFLLPGTHSKWVDANADGIAHFTTYLTGELFSALLSGGTIGPLVSSVPDPDIDGNEADDAFCEGLEASRINPGLLGQLFRVRAGVLLGDLTAEAVRPFLSGLLIGNEIDEAVRRLALAEIHPDRAGADAVGQASVCIVAGTGLSARYAQGLAHRGIRYHVGVADAAAHGLFALAKHRELLG